MSALIIKPDGTTKTRKHTSHDAWRKLEKRPRAPARFRHWKPEQGQKLTEAGLTLYEAELGIAAVAEDHGFKVGRVLGYDGHANMFHVVGTRYRDRKPVDAKIAGWKVSQAIICARLIAGVDRLERGAE